MKSLRKKIGAGPFGAGSPESDLLESSDECEVPPPPIGRDERRIQLRGYNLWSDLLGDGDLPTIADLVLEDDPYLAAHAVLLDFTAERNDPLIAFLGDELAAECGISARQCGKLSAIPDGSLLARIAEHYLHAIVQPAPIGFEAEFVNQRERTILYRGILLPFCGHGTTIDFVLGVLGWKELADPATADMLLRELGLAVDSAAAEPRGEVAEGESADCSANELIAGQAPPAGELRPAAPSELEKIGADGGEFALVLVRRSGTGSPVVLAEVPRESSLFERAARRLLG